MNKPNIAVLLSSSAVLFWCTLLMFYSSFHVMLAVPFNRPYLFLSNSCNHRGNYNQSDEMQIMEHQNCRQCANQNSEGTPASAPRQCFIRKSNLTTINKTTFLLSPQKSKEYVNLVNYGFIAIVNSSSLLISNSANPLVNLCNYYVHRAEIESNSLSLK